MVFKDALQIVSGIRNARKQQSFLWKEQEKAYKGVKKVLLLLIEIR